MIVFLAVHSKGRALGGFSYLRFAPWSTPSWVAWWFPAQHSATFPRAAQASLLARPCSCLTVSIFSWPLHSRSICLTWLTSSGRTPSSCLENATPQGVSSPSPAPSGHLCWGTWMCAASAGQPAPYRALWLWSSKKEQVLWNSTGRESQVRERCENRFASRPFSLPSEKAGSSRGLALEDLK